MSSAFSVQNQCFTAVKSIPYVESMPSYRTYKADLRDFKRLCNNLLPPGRRFEWSIHNAVTLFEHAQEKRDNDRLGRRLTPLVVVSRHEKSARLHYSDNLNRQIITNHFPFTAQQDYYQPLDQPLDPMSCPLDEYIMCGNTLFRWSGTTWSDEPLYKLGSNLRPRILDAIRRQKEQVKAQARKVKIRPWRKALGMKRRFWKCKPAGCIEEFYGITSEWQYLYRSG